MQPFFIIKKARLQRSGAFAMIFNWILKRVNQQIIRLLQTHVKLREIYYTR